MNEKIQRVSVKGIVYTNGSIFMIKDQNGNWELPGGRIDFGEHPQVALKREFNEELGVNDIEVGNIVNVWDFTTSASSDEYHFVIVVFECKADLSKINISDEHSEYRWINLSEIHEYPMRKGYIESVDKFKNIKNL